MGRRRHGESRGPGPREQRTICVKREGHRIHFWFWKEVWTGIEESVLPKEYCLYYSGGKLREPLFPCRQRITVTAGTGTFHLYLDRQELLEIKIPVSFSFACDCLVPEVRGELDGAGSNWDSLS